MATSSKRRDPKHRKRRSQERTHSRRRQHVNRDPDRQENWRLNPSTVEDSRWILLRVTGRDCCIFFRIEVDDCGPVLDELEQLGTVTRLKSDGLLSLNMTKILAENCREKLFQLIDDGQIVVQDTMGVYLDRYRQELDPAD